MAYQDLVQLFPQDTMATGKGGELSDFEKPLDKKRIYGKIAKCSFEYGGGLPSDVFGPLAQLVRATGS